MSAKKGDRVGGPYRTKHGWRLRYVVGGEESFARFATREEAARRKRAFTRAIGEEDRTVSAALDEYERHLERRGNSASGVRTTMHRLRGLLAPVLDDHPDVLTRARAQRLYDQYVETPHRYRKVAGEDGQILRVPMHRSAATHHNALNQARTWARWLARRGLLTGKILPFVDVETVGRKRRGKTTLRADELRRWTAAARAEGSDAAEAALVVAFLGLRAGEALGLVARAVDEGGAVLWIGRSTTKTDAGERQIGVAAEFIREILARRAESGGNLWPGRGGKRGVDWLARNVRRLCRLAGVPEVSTQSLRATHSTIGQEHGVAAEAVAAAIGHASPSVTRAHYTAPGTAETAQGARVLRIVEGGRR